MNFFEDFKHLKGLDVGQIQNLLKEREEWTSRDVFKEHRKILDSLFECQSEVQIGDTIEVNSHELTKEQKEFVEKASLGLRPWKKGPYNLFGTLIDSEWRSDLKWNRIKDAFDLKGKTVLDIGCNNGYFMFRMLEQNPRFVLGIDPVPALFYQFHFLNHFFKAPHIQFEMLGVEHLPLMKNCFDVIFSMGILYHHRHPLEQLLNKRESLRPGGELILETITVPGKESVCFFPPGRYARMKNVWFLPTLKCLENWLKRCRFDSIELIFDEPLTSEEQRVTSWSSEVSFSDFLDPHNPELTEEGHPAPRRTAFKARRKK